MALRNILILGAIAGIASCGGSRSAPGNDSGTAAGLDGATMTELDGSISGSDAGLSADGASSGMEGSAPPGDGASPASDASTSPAGLHAVMGTGGRAGHLVDQAGHVVVLHGAD